MSLIKSNAMDAPIRFVWKNKPFRDNRIPEDALRPSCEVFMQMSPNSPAVRDSDVTDMHDWFYVVKYQAFPEDRSSNVLFPELDEVRGTENDYESADDQLKDTYQYSRVDWVFILFCIFFFGGLFLNS